MPHPSPTPRPEPHIAYFSMEIGLESDIPTYSGGLGVLAGDTLRAAADLGLPTVAVTLVHREGYFRQALEEGGRQVESPDPWSPDVNLGRLEPEVAVELEGRQVRLRAWEYEVRGERGHVVPVYLLDSDLDGNTEEDRALTDHLYGGDDRYRLLQEAVLGLGGAALLDAMGHRKIRTFHMNEGHSALLPLALVEARAAERAGGEPTTDDVEWVRERCVFTTHTPVPAGHDRFAPGLVEAVLGPERVRRLAALGIGADDGAEHGIESRVGSAVGSDAEPLHGAEAEGVSRAGAEVSDPARIERADGSRARGAEAAGGQVLDMTRLALHFSRFVNGVALRHAQISREMFPGERIAAITNGVHTLTWTAPSMAELFDRHIPAWRTDPLDLRHACILPLDELAAARAAAKKRLVDVVRRRSGGGSGERLDPDVLTLGFARRATPYKRADLLFTDPERLAGLARAAGGLQIVYAGKAHPRDEGGKRIIRRIHEAAAALDEPVRVVYLPDYDMELGGVLTSGVDVWLNNPRKPREASGTSGMKAALNGVPNLSVLDGWWIEGHIEGVTGWAIGGDWDEPSDDEAEAEALYETLEEEVVPLYTAARDGDDRLDRIRRHSIALNGPHFSARRMMLQYVERAYRVE